MLVTEEGHCFIIARNPKEDNGSVLLWVIYRGKGIQGSPVLLVD